VNSEETIARRATNEKIDVKHIDNESSDIRVKSIKGRSGK